MTKEITVERLDRTIQLCRQNAFWGKPSAVPKMLDFYFEKTRTSVNEDWPGIEGMEAAPLGELRYRIYYSKDLLTCRIFIFRPHCTWDEQKIMLDMGFVHAEDGDADNIPNQPLEEGVEEELREKAKKEQRKAVWKVVQAMSNDANLAKKKAGVEE